MLHLLHVGGLALVHRGWPPRRSNENSVPALPWWDPRGAPTSVHLYVIIYRTSGPGSKRCSYQCGLPLLAPATEAAA